VADPHAAAAWAGMSATDRDTVTGVFVNLGKAIAAFERTLSPPATRFDAYVASLEGQGGATLSDDEIAGLQLFIGRANCSTCHTCPLFTDGQFHNTGVSAATGLPDDFGRSSGIEQVRADPFNCIGRWSDASPDDCEELKYLGDPGEETLRAFKAPSLRGAASRSPYMHAGQFADLSAVLDHYATAPVAPMGHSELVPIELSEEEKAQIAAFLATLDP
jgi:cytochrome c peroxidase